MRRVFILYENFYTPDGKDLSIGGIQTYIKMLVKVIKENNLEPVIFQYSNINFNNIYDGISVYGIEMEKKWSKKRKNKVLFDECKKYYNHENDIIIFACETMSVKNTEKRIIGIQHGITWDVRGHEHFSHQKNMLFIFWRAIKAYKTIKRLNDIKKLIAVDYNFLNWYRTQVAYTEREIEVIPNCTRLNKSNKKQDGKINIVFARRFQKYRGTRLFAAVAHKLLEKYTNVNITFAGSGPDEKYLKDIFRDNLRVNFLTYRSEDSLSFHSEYHIAVVPTIGSEGTSLSLLEAMSSNCAVVATNVGGITNVVVDQYNGLLVNPDEVQLFNALERLILDKNLRVRFGENGYQTISQAFNINIWENRWSQVLNDTINI
ncbi:glycosyltransferase family 4 protein [Paenibacillus aceris]|uniref:Glycosyltransferase involved in cell wall biosynthesis n=1 Tax=Paenibacillus aceris TaxID=869555 RepID=A0ABS4HUM4_9BACL|nr:glycosyltransferase family 4 protein [Paenibacillus aceris]MBP1962307.1 glycosyltransferase involved in cell wall biosynthesis [Paenibacillus aceris]NHW37130.1 glycosyltransferase family 4 protein [Paenibacillus aceris]